MRADMVTYGKTLGGGLPVGVLCGRKDLMRRFRDDRPADICFARGTFNSHPYVMGAMHEFLRHLETPEIRALYAGLDDVWNGARAAQRAPAREGLPVQVANLSSIWTVCYTQPSRYNWMLQYLSARRGPGVELDRHRPVDLQPQLHGGGFRCGGGPFRRCRQSDAAGRLVVGRSGHHQQVHPALDPARDDCPPLLVPSRLSERQVQAAGRG